MRRKGNLRERICALLLAVLLPFTSVLPHMTLVVHAEEAETPGAEDVVTDEPAVDAMAAGSTGEPQTGAGGETPPEEAPEVPVEKSISFFIYESFTKEDGGTEEVGVSDAEIKIYEDDKVVKGASSTKEGNCTILVSVYKTKSYTYQVMKNGFDESGIKSLDVAATKTIKQELKMKSIKLNPTGAVELNLSEDTGKTKKVSIEEEIKNTHDRQEYTWTTDNEKVAAVDQNGNITGVGRGEATITVSRYGQTATIPVTVKEAIQGMTITATPGSGENDNRVDVTSVELSVSGLPGDAKGTVTIRQDGSDIGTITAPYTGKVSCSVTPPSRHTFQAYYTAAADEYYYNAEAATNEISYKKTLPLVLQTLPEKATYGTADPKVSPVEATIGDRTLSYQSSNPQAVAVDEDGQLHILTVPKDAVTITVTAAENDSYTLSEAKYTFSVQKKPLRISQEDAKKIIWQSAEKIYDGKASIPEVTGTLSSAPEMIEGDAITVKAKAEVSSADAGMYTNCKISNVSVDSEKYDVTFADPIKEASFTDDRKIEITRRPVYIEIEKKTGDYESTVTYGQTNDAIEEYIQKDNALVLCGAKGQLGNNEKQGLLEGDTLESLNLNLDTYADIKLMPGNAPGETYYVNAGGETYNNAIQAVLKSNNDNNDKAGNYQICVAEGDEHCGRLQVTNEILSDAEIAERVKLTVTKAEYGGQTGSDFWVRGNGEAQLSFSLADVTYYDQIHVSTDGGKSYLTFSGESKPVLQFADQEDAEKNLKIYFSNSNDKNTRTVNEENKGGKDNEYRIKIDAKLPEVTFEGINAGLFSDNTTVPFGKYFSRESYKVTMSASDGESGSGVKSLETCVIQVQSGENTHDKVIEADENKKIWEQGIGTKAEKDVNTEGNHILLARVTDNVGHVAIYTSDGLVYDMSVPDVTIVVNGGNPIDGATAGDSVPYKIEISDIFGTNSGNSSGIDKIEIEVTDNGRRVGDNTSLNADGYAVDSYTVTSADIDKIIGKTNEDHTTLSYLAARSEFTMDGLLTIRKYHTNNVRIHVNVYDKAGNVRPYTYPESDEAGGIQLDTILPQVSVSYDDNEAQEKNYFTNREMTIVYTERNFDESVLSFDVEINGEKRNGSGEGGRLTFAELKSLEQTGNIKVSERKDSQAGADADDWGDDRTNTYTLTFTDGAYKIIPYITDTAGNKNSGVSYGQEVSEDYDANELFVIDSKAPEMKVTYDYKNEEGKAYSHQTEVTIEYTERNFDEKLLSFELEKDGEAIEGTAADKRLSLEDLKKCEGVEAVMAEDSEADKAEYSHTDARTLTYQITFIENGSYRLVPHIKDKAANVETSTGTNHTFYVDQEAPRVTVAYQDEAIGVSNGRYFNQVRTMEITFQERNFTLDGIRFDLKAGTDEKQMTSYESISYEQLKEAAEKYGIEMASFEDNEAETDENKHTDQREVKLVLRFGTDKKDFVYQIMPYITDKAGNSNDGLTDKGQEVGTGGLFTVDMVKPVTEVHYFLLDQKGNKIKDIPKDDIGTKIQDSMYKNAVIAAEVSVTERNFAENPTFTDKEMKVTETAADVNGTAVSFKGHDAAAKKVSNWSGSTEQTALHSQTFVFEEDANYTFNMYYKDLAGNEVKLIEEQEEGHYFTVDTGCPAGKIEKGEEKVYKSFCSMITFLFFSNKQDDVEFLTEAEDATSPVKISYYKHYPGRDTNGAFEALQPEELEAINEWTYYSGQKDPYEYGKTQPYTCKVGLNEQVVLYEKLEDKAGNITYLDTDGVVCEKTPSDIEIQITTEAPETTFGVGEEAVVYDGEVSFDIRAKDPAVKDGKGNDAYAGLNKVSYAVYVNGKEGSVKGEITYDPGARQESCEIKDIIIPADEYNSNDIEIKVTAADNAGNTANMYKTLKIDTTKPKITVSYDHNDAANERYFKEDREMHITYQERNINQDGLTFYFKAGKKETGEYLTLKELREAAEASGLEISEGLDSHAGREAEKYDDERTLEYTIKFTGGKGGDMDYELIPYIEDQAGNSSKDLQGEAIVEYSGTIANQRFTIDKAAPELKAEYYLVEDGKLEKINVSTDFTKRLFKNKTIRAVVTIEERNFSLEDEFSDLPKQMKPHFTWKEDDGTVGDVSGFETSAGGSGKWTSNGSTRTQAFEFEADGDYSFSMEYEDLAGNTLKEAYPVHHFTVDKTKPEIKVTYEVDGRTVTAEEMESDPLYEQKPITAVVEITERNFHREDSAAHFEEKQMQLSYSAVDALNKAVETENYTKNANTREMWTADGYVRKQSFTFKNDANYRLEIAYKDLAGNALHFGPQTFTVDETPPTGTVQIRESVWGSFSRIVFFNIFTKGTETVTMTSGDATSGVAATQYYKYIPHAESRGRFAGLTREELDQITNWTDGYKTSVSANQQAIIYEKITDRAGNVTYVNAEEGIIADNTSPQAPVITITTADPPQGIYSGNVNFSIDVTDPENGGTYAGLKKVWYEVTRDGAVTQQKDYDFDDPAQRVHNVHYNEVVNAELNNSNHVKIKVHAVDYADNTAEAEKDIAIDITQPQVQITYDLNSPSNGRYYNATRTALVSVKERNFDPNAVSFSITNTDGTMPSISGWSISPSAGETDEAVNTCMVSFAADGDYTLTMNCKDKAGNASSYTQVDDFTIDKTAPTIQVTFDNNSAANAGYYDKPRTAAITVNEHNFNGSEVQAAVSASLEAQGISAPGVNGWSGSGDSHLATIHFGADGDYSFTVNYTDLAGNAATAFTQEKFTVDQTKPEIEIFDIQDKSANNGVVAPGVRYSDVNYDTAGVKLTIKGPKHAEKAIEGTHSQTANGESIKMNDFAYEESVDDVYTMTAQITDLAGNMDEKSVTFSVNRFGSNFVFGASTEKFLEKYYSNQEQDLVVTEINVDTLEHHGISYGLDGEMVNLIKGTDYTVKESGKETSWKSYEYTIKSANFEQEGLYNVTIDSTDRANNVGNNKIKSADIEFVIDKTKPTVVITGIEDDGQYRTSSRDIIIAVADNVAMDSLDVYVEGTENSTRKYDAETILEQRGEIPFSMESSSNWQEIKAVAVDAAGNTADTSSMRVLITSNVLVQFIRNTPLVAGSAAGIAAAAAGMAFIIPRRKILFRKKNKKQ